MLALSPEFKDVAPDLVTGKINARVLHTKLCIKTRFNDWIERGIQGFVKGVDFEFYSELSKKAGRPKVNCLVSVFMAQHLALMANTAEGMKIRSFYISIVNHALNAKAPSTSLVPLELRVATVEERVDLITSDTGYKTVLTFAKEEGIKLPIKLSREIGRQAGKLCREYGRAIGKVPDERHGKVNSYPVEILEEAVEALTMKAYH